MSSVTPILDEAAIKRFEIAWQAGERPEIQAYLQDAASRQSLLVELVHVEFELRYRQGERPAVEEYLQRYPELSASETTVLELIEAEHSLRQRYGPPTTWHEYLSRFPQHRSALERRLIAEGSTISTTPRGKPPAKVKPNIAGYVIEEELGQGGMGVVYRATQPQLQRAVAIKTLLFGIASTEDLRRRFRTESEAIARLDHPHLVPIYEVGEWTPDGASTAIPYFVMKFYPGGSLANNAAGPGTDLHEHARTVEIIAQAVHHAHQRGILHRDLKPSNILLDENGKPHVVDFGLAGRFDPGAPKSMTGTIMGTPAYMAPEQLLTPGQVTTAADVYGLGAILYQLITGKTPFRTETPLALLDQVAHDPPQRPTVINPAIPRDLETICLKCLEKDPAQRYDSAAALAQELERFRHGRSILARPTPTWERAWRVVKRHPVISTLSAAMVALLLVSVAVLAESNFRIREQKEQTDIALQREKWAHGELMSTFNREQQLLYGKRIFTVGRLWNSNQLQQAWEELEACPPKYRGWEWRYFDGLRSKPPVSIETPTQIMRAIAFVSSDEIITGDGQGMATLWNWRTQQVIKSWKAVRDDIRSLSVHPPKQWLAICDPDRLMVWNYATGEKLTQLPAGSWVTFSPDGRYLAAAESINDEATNRVLVWDTTTWKQLWAFEGHTKGVLNGTICPESITLATCSSDRTVRRWNLQTGKPEGEPWTRPLPTFRLAYLRDNQTLAEAQPSAMLWSDAKTGKELGRYNWSAVKQPVVVTARVQVTTGPLPNIIGVSGPSHDVQVWDVQRNRNLAILRGHNLHIGGLEFSPDGRYLASISYDKTIKIWEFDQPVEYQSKGNLPMLVNHFSLSADGTKVAVVPNFHTSLTQADAGKVLGVNKGEVLSTFPGMGVVLYTPDGHLLTAQARGGVECWNIAEKRLIWQYDKTTERCIQMALGADERTVVAMLFDGRVMTLDRATGAVVNELRVAPRFVGTAGLCSNHQRLAFVGPREAELWDLKTGKRTGQFPLNGIRQFVFSRDGQLMASAEADRVVRLRNPTTGTVIRTFPGHPRTINSMAFSPDGKRLVTACADGQIRLWDVENGLELVALPGLFEETVLVEWDHRNDRIVALDTKVHVWGAKTGAKKLARE